MPRTIRVFAVLTGDLVKSSRLTSTQSRDAMRRIRKAGVEFGECHPDVVVGRVDTFRHDSWQLLLAGQELAVRAAVFVRACLRMQSDSKVKYDTRIAIGVGPVEWVSKRRISESRGPAFTMSGKALDAMSGACLAYGVADGIQDAANAWIAHGVVPLLDCIVGDWSAIESRAVYGALRGWDQELSASHWPVNPVTGKRPTRQNVSKAMARAHWKVVQGICRLIEQSPGQPHEIAEAESNL